MKNRIWFGYTLSVLFAGLLCMISVRAYQTQYTDLTLGERYVSDQERMMRLSGELPKLYRQIQLLETRTDTSPALNRQIGILQKRYDSMKKEVELLGGHITQKGNSVVIRWKAHGAKR